MKTRLVGLNQEITEQKINEKLATSASLIEQINSITDVQRQKEGNYLSAAIRTLMYKEADEYRKINALLKQKDVKGLTEHEEAELLIRQDEVQDIAEDIKLLKENLSAKMHGVRITQSDDAFKQLTSSSALRAIKEEKLTPINDQINILANTVTQVVSNMERLVKELKSLRGTFVGRELGALIFPKTQVAKAGKITELQNCLKEQLTYLGQAYYQSSSLYYYQDMYGGESTKTTRPWRDVAKDFENIHARVEARLSTLPKIVREKVAGDATDAYATFAKEHVTRKEQRDKNAYTTGLTQLYGGGKAAEPHYPFSYIERNEGNKKRR